MIFVIILIGCVVVVSARPGYLHHHQSHFYNAPPGLGGRSDGMAGVALGAGDLDGLGDSGLGGYGLGSNGLGGSGLGGLGYGGTRQVGSGPFGAGQQFAGEASGFDSHGSMGSSSSGFGQGKQSSFQQVAMAVGAQQSKGGVMNIDGQGGFGAHNSREGFVRLPARF